MEEYLSGPKKTIIFTIARMNPPTSGHMGLIKALLQANLELPRDDPGHGKVYVILSSSVDPISDPLLCNDKKVLLIAEGMIEKIKRDNPQFSGIEVIIYCMSDTVEEDLGAHPILKHIRQIIRNEQPTDMKLIIGADRGIKFDEFDTVIENNYKFVEDDIRRQGVKINETVPEIKANILSRPPGAMSATKMRRLVAIGNKEEFVSKSLEAGLSAQDAAELFDKLYSIIRGGIIDMVKKIPKKNLIRFFKPLNTSLGLSDADAIEVIKNIMLELKEDLELGTADDVLRRIEQIRLALEEERIKAEEPTPAKKQRTRGGKRRTRKNRTEKNYNNKRSNNKRSNNKRTTYKKNRYTRK